MQGDLLEGYQSMRVTAGEAQRRGQIQKASGTALTGPAEGWAVAEESKGPGESRILPRFLALKTGWLMVPITELGSLGGWGCPALVNCP